MQTEQIDAQNIQKKPLVSFIITAYNLPVSMIEECLKSVIDLSLRAEDREIILVDDGSEISQINDLLNFRDDIIYLRQSNRGLSAARNIGIRLANGKYIQFIDGDDVIIKVHYEHCLDIVRYHNPDMVMFNTNNSKKAEIPFSFEGPIAGNKYMHDYNLKSSVWGYIFKKSILTGLRFTPDSLHEDEEFTPQLLLRVENLYITNANAYYYRKRKNSIMTNTSKEHIQRRLTDMRRVLFHLQDIADRIPRLDSLAMKRRVDQLTMDYLYNIIKLTHNAKILDDAIEHLRSRGLFPLPDKNYTKKYNLFRKAIKTKIGRRLLLTII